ETQEEGVVRDECKPCRDRVPGCGDLTEFVEQTSPVDVGVRAPGIKLDRVLEVCQSPLHVTQLQPGIRTVVVGLGEWGRPIQGPLIGGDGLFVSSESTQAVADV